MIPFLYVMIPFLYQDLRNDSTACPQDIDLSLRPEHSVGKQSQHFCGRVAVAFPYGNAIAALPYGSANVMTQLRRFCVSPMYKYAIYFYCRDVTCNVST